MGEQFLFDTFGIPVVLWVVLYISDYYLTIWGAYLYAHGAQAHFSLEGSYELNPFYEKDINLLRTISPRFLIYLFASTVVLLIVRGLTRDLPFLFIFLSGGLLLLEVFVHFRHIRNIVLFWHASHEAGVSGQIHYARWYSYRASAVDALVFAVFLAAVALLGGSWFFAGGALGCLWIGLRHSLQVGRLRKATPTAAQPKQNS